MCPYKESIQWSKTGYWKLHTSGQKSSVRNSGYCWMFTVHKWNNLTGYWPITVKRNIYFYKFKATSYVWFVKRVSAFDRSVGSNVIAKHAIEVKYGVFTENVKTSISGYCNKLCKINWKSPDTKINQINQKLN